MSWFSSVWVGEGGWIWKKKFVTRNAVWRNWESWSEKWQEIQNGSNVTTSQRQCLQESTQKRGAVGFENPPAQMLPEQMLPFNILTVALLRSRSCDLTAFNLIIDTYCSNVNRSCIVGFQERIHQHHFNRHPKGVLHTGKNCISSKEMMFPICWWGRSGNDQMWK